jgi:hypothetical protein
MVVGNFERGLSPADDRPSAGGAGPPDAPQTRDGHAARTLAFSVPKNRTAPIIRRGSGRTGGEGVLRDAPRVSLFVGGYTLNGTCTGVSPLRLPCPAVSVYGCGGRELHVVCACAIVHLMLKNLLTSRWWGENDCPTRLRRCLGSGVKAWRQGVVLRFTPVPSRAACDVCGFLQLPLRT